MSTIDFGILVNSSGPFSSILLISLLTRVNSLRSESPNRPPSTGSFLLLTVFVFLFWVFLHNSTFGSFFPSKFFLYHRPLEIWYLRQIQIFYKTDNIGKPRIVLENVRELTSFSTFHISYYNQKTGVGRPSVSV